MGNMRPLLQVSCDRGRYSVKTALPVPHLNLTFRGIVNKNQGGGARISVKTDSCL